MTSALPDAHFTGEYDRLFGADADRQKGERSVINKKLLSFDRGALRYVGANVAFQWLGMLCNVIFVRAIARLVGGGLCGQPDRSALWQRPSALPAHGAGALGLHPAGIRHERPGFQEMSSAPCAAASTQS